MLSTLTINTYSKMHTYTEGSVLKVRRELLKLGCKDDDISVAQHMTSLKLAYGNQQLIAKPFEVLAILKSIRRPVKTIDIWAILCLSQQAELQDNNKRIKRALFASLLMLVLLSAYLVISEQFFN